MNGILKSPEFQNAVASVLKKPAFSIVAEIESLSAKKVSGWLENCTAFMKNNFNELGSSPYVIELVDENDKTKTLEPLDIINKCKLGFNVFKIDHMMRLVGFDNIQALSGSKLSQYSRANRCALLHIINGVDFIIYANGLTIREMNTNRPTMRDPIIKPTSRSGYDYELSLQEHYKNRVRYSQACNHWHDKKKRILIGDRKTEDIFQENLLNWYIENLYDSHVIGKVNKLSKDETDIEIKPIQGGNYLLEIKWLGKNASGTEYPASRIKEGIIQVKNYLKRDTDVLEATIIVYDGRPLDSFNSIKHDKEEPEQWKIITQFKRTKLPLRGKAYVFFLESEAASKRK